MVFLTRQPEEIYTGGPQIAQAIGRPFPFLTKNLTRLAHGGLLETKRGVNGGVRLAKPAAAITLMEIARALGEEGLFEECVLGSGRCSENATCVIHPKWGTIKKDLLEMMLQTTLAQVAAEKPPLNA